VTAIGELVAWARSRGIAAELGGELVVRRAESDRLAVLDDFEALTLASPTIDFGRWQERVPAAVVRPRSEPELIAVLAELGARGLGHVVRGRGHGSGGSALAHARDVVIDAASVELVAPLAAGVGEVAIAAGASLDALVEVLARVGRRPLGLPTNLAQTVGGTLAVGGFTESTHVHGLFAEAATRLRIVTAEGAREVEPGEAWFDVTLGGDGEAGAITAAVLRSAPGAMHVDARMLQWRSLEEFLPDAIRIAELRLFGYLRPRVVRDLPGVEVEAMVGDYVDPEAAPARGDGALAFLRGGVAAGPITRIDLAAELRAATAAPKHFACPALELVFPYPDEQDRIVAFVRDVGAWLAPHLPRGIALAIARGGSRFPRLPLPAAGWGVMVAVRPELAPRAAIELLPRLRAAGRRALDGSRGLRYRVSIPLDEPQVSDERA
jgi:hypothetical protein